MNVLKTLEKDTCSVTSLGRSQHVNINIFHKVGLLGIFSILLDAKWMPYIAEPK